MVCIFNTHSDSLPRRASQHALHFHHSSLIAANSTSMAFILITASLLFLWIVSLTKIFILSRTPFTKHFTQNGTASFFFCFFSKTRAWILFYVLFYFFPSIFVFLACFQVELFGRGMSCWSLLTLMMNPCKFETANFVVCNVKLLMTLRSYLWTNACFSLVQF